MSRRLVTPKTVVLAFVKMINAHDVDGLVGLMTQDHVFVDSLGRSFKGREAMKGGWMEYFGLFSQYRITVTDVFEKLGTIVLLGTATGIYVDRKSATQTRWKVPAAWKAVVVKEKISEWRVFADNFQTMKLVTGN